MKRGYRIVVNPMIGHNYTDSAVVKNERYVTLPYRKSQHQDIT